MGCDLWIDPPLSRETLAVVRPPGATPLLPGLEWLELVEYDPRQALEVFVTGWYPEADPAPPARTVPAFVPPALADFYRLAERRPAILGKQNAIEPLAALTPGGCEGRLVFAVENQGGWDWSLPWQPNAADTDPAVVLTRDGASTPEQEPLSRFLLQFSLHEAAVTAPYQADVRGALLENVWEMIGLSVLLDIGQTGAMPGGRRRSRTPAEYVVAGAWPEAELEPHSGARRIQLLAHRLSDVMRIRSLSPFRVAAPG
ncbi:hypothetical protein [Streptomyces sp. NPDC002537]